MLGKIVWLIGWLVVQFLLFTIPMQRVKRTSCQAHLACQMSRCMCCICQCGLPGLVLIAAVQPNLALAYQITIGRTTIKHKRMRFGCIYTVSMHTCMYVCMQSSHNVTLLFLLAPISTGKFIIFNIQLLFWFALANYLSWGKAHTHTHTHTLFLVSNSYCTCTYLYLSISLLLQL